MKSKSIALNEGKDKDTFKSVYKYEATCPSECTKRLKQSIWIDAAGPHMHSYGRQIWLDQWRDGVLINTIVRTDYWNFGFQRIVAFENPIEVKPGDELVTNCIMDTSATALDKVTFGAASENEMCMVSVWYHPQTDIILGDSEIPFSLCSYAFPKFKDSSK